MEGLIFVVFMVIGGVLAWRGAGRLAQWICGLLAPDPRLNIDKAAFMGEPNGGIISVGFDAIAEPDAKEFDKRITPL